MKRLVKYFALLLIISMTAGTTIQAADLGIENDIEVESDSTSEELTDEIIESEEAPGAMDEDPVEDPIEEPVAEPEAALESGSLKPILKVETHVQNIGWRVETGNIVGTTGKALRLEAIKIQVVDAVTGKPIDNLSVEYNVHVQNIGWQGFVADGKIAGTTGKSLRIEAIQIRLTGTKATEYKLFSKAHCSDVGWLAWGGNNESIGTSGLGKRMEAIEFSLMKRDEVSKDTSGRKFIEGFVRTDLTYSGHVQNRGDIPFVPGGTILGTVGQGLRMEGITLKLARGTQSLSGNIEYRTHIQDYGWSSYVKEGAFSGTHGQAKRLEAIQIRLTGELASRYDIYYRTHVQNYGWLGWAKNDQMAGSAGCAYRMEAVQIVLVAKGLAVPGQNTNYFKDKPVPKRKLVVIDAGHQARGDSTLEPIGPGSSTRKPKVSSGTTGVATGIPEYRLNLEVSLQLERELIKRGYDVKMVRTTHDVNISNSRRAQMANEWGADAFVRIHANGDSNRSVNGALTMCMTPRNPYNGGVYGQSRALSEAVLNGLSSATGARKLSIIETDSMSGINWCTRPSTIVEMGFMSNAAEDRLLNSSAYQAKMVQGIANGIDTYFGY